MKALAFLLLSAWMLNAASYTEFYCNSTGTNINGGSSTNASPDFTFASGDWTNTSSTSGIFHKTGADFSTVTIGMWLSVITNADTMATFGGMVAAVNDVNDVITLTNQTWGVSPATFIGSATINIGGAWYGPFGTVRFPFDYVGGQATNNNGYIPRGNLWSGRIYSVTNLVDSINTGARRYEGYTNTPGDGGRAIFDGGSVGNSHIMFTVSGKNCDYVNMTFQTNGTSSGTQREIVSVTGGENMFYRCLFRFGRRYGILANAVVTMIECESYTNNLSNTSGTGAMAFLVAGTQVINCISHHNTTANTAGFALDQSMLVYGDIAHNNGGDGFTTAGDVNQTFMNCDSYNNGGDGIEIANIVSSCHQVINCNMIKNGGFGLRVGSGSKNGQIRNCGFGSGTMANTLGTVSIAHTGMGEFGSVTYAADTTPWNNPDAGDFSITLTAAKNAGYQSYLQLMPAYTAFTTGYPDIGAAQSTNSGGSASTVVVPQIIFTR